MGKDIDFTVKNELTYGRGYVYITNQDAVLYPARVGGSSAAGAELKLPA